MSNKSGPLTAVSAHPRGSAIVIVVSPRSPRNALEIAADGALRVRVAAPPVDGAANAAVLRLLADLLGVPRSRLEIASGASARHKRVTIAGLTPDLVVARLQRALRANR
jgi:uncharacterized protein (TIGR00251 family)